MEDMVFSNICLRRGSYVCINVYIYRLHDYQMNNDVVRNVVVTEDYLK